MRAVHIGLTVGGESLKWAFGAQFAEVRVPAETDEIRVARLTGAFAAGRVLNPLTARSRLVGGIIWGLGFPRGEHPRSGLRRRRLPIRGEAPV